MASSLNFLVIALEDITKYKISFYFAYGSIAAMYACRDLFFALRWLLTRPTVTRRI